MIDFTLLDNQGDGNIQLSNQQFSQMIDYSIFMTGNVLIDEDTKSVIEQSFLYLVDLPQDAEELAFGNTTWHIKILPNVVKSSVVASIMMGLLHAAGATQLASLVLPAILPLLVDIETIRLSVKDDLILSEMRRHESLKDNEFWPQEIYGQLHVSTQEQISFSEFLDVLDVLSLSGNVERDENTGLFQLNDKKKFRIHIS